MPTTQKSYTLTMPPELLDQLKARWQATFPAHGLSFNAWIVRRLARWPKRNTAAKHS